MSSLKRIVDLIFSRQVFVFVALLLIALAIWFVGPLFGFGGLYPMVGTAMRVTLIVLLLAALLGRLMHLPASIVGVAAFCLLIWNAGPLLVLGDVQPLASEWLRVLIVSMVVIGYGTYWLYKLVQAMRSDDDLLRKVFHPIKNQSSDVARVEIHAVRSVVSKAIRQLKMMRGLSGITGLLEGKRYLYALPWYMIIGTTGAGKTTVIRNSGLEFPLVNEASEAALTEQNGTHNCDYWYANDSVLIDTAGRYVEQDDQKSGKTKNVNAAEWTGLLGQLRKYRPRAPLNGVLLTVSVPDLLKRTSESRAILGTTMRARLTELRSNLGIRFPVYVVITKLDFLPGFSEYFQSLTVEQRAQIWGFTLPYHKESVTTVFQKTGANYEQELALLGLRLEAGVDSRLQEEYDLVRRKKLYALPQEFRSLSVLLTEFLGQVFLDSLYDDTQLRSGLRGVYFTSAAQTGEILAVDRATLFQRFRRGLEELKTLGGDQPGNNSQGSSRTNNRSFFLDNLFRHVIIPEAHLVRPNLRWEWRFRLIRMVGHFLTITLFVWFGSALVGSFGNNHRYLQTIKGKTLALEELVMSYRKNPNLWEISTVLDSARDLSRYKDLNVESPGGAYRYGLYAAPAIEHSGQKTYASLQQQLLLPQIVRRIDTALAANIKARDADAVYDTLAAYLMLFDKDHFNGQTIKSWVLHDWERFDSAEELGGQTALMPHLTALFAEGQQVQSLSPKNEDLIRVARTFLDNNPITTRLYKRAIAAMEKEAPDNFTLLRVLGPQANVILTMKNGSSLERGVPGLYSYHGYHHVFNKRLPEFVSHAQIADAWVMGRRGDVKQAYLAQGNGVHALTTRTINDIRRQYLTDYGNYWYQFLDDIRPLSSIANVTTGSLALDVQALRILAAPDSPLVRLARAATSETSLSFLASSADESLTDKALAIIGKTSEGVRTPSSLPNTLNANGRGNLKLEKELVDNRFAALREVVTGQADTGSGPALRVIPVVERALQLDAIVGLLNEQYTLLVVADNALANSELPLVNDIGDKLRMESARLPQPFQAVLYGVAEHASETVRHDIKRLQTAKLKEAVALLSMQIETGVGHACRTAIEGKYPFVTSNQEVDIEDFIRVFSSGGLIDDFFQKHLTGLVDSSIKPWRYKVVDSALPVVSGPDLAPFERAAAIREVFFRDPGSKRMSWKMNVKVTSIDPAITQLLVDIDGQAFRYSHGPILPFRVSWPGPRGGAMAEISANPRVRPDTSSDRTDGPWALFHLVARGRAIETASSNRVAVEYTFDGRQVVLDLQTDSLPNPLTGKLFDGFHCPTGII
ncbi:type VI secretion system membrane subunit TssM [Glaciimonas sp. GNP009]